MNINHNDLREHSGMEQDHWIKIAFYYSLPTTFRLNWRLRTGVVDIWHSYTPVNVNLSKIIIQLQRNYRKELYLCLNRIKKHQKCGDILNKLNGKNMVKYEMYKDIFYLPSSSIRVSLISNTQFSLLGLWRVENLSSGVYRNMPVVSKWVPWCLIHETWYKEIY